MLTTHQQGNILMINGTDIDDFYRKLGIAQEKERKSIQKETEPEPEKSEPKKKTYTLRMVTRTDEV